MGVRMIRSSLRDAAERHRSVASLLSDPTDRNIINDYADEVDALARREMPEPSVCSPVAANAGPRLIDFSGMLKAIYQPNPTHLFDDLLDGLGKADR